MWPLWAFAVSARACRWPEGTADRRLRVNSGRVYNWDGTPPTFSVLAAMATAAVEDDDNNGLRGDSKSVSPERRYTVLMKLILVEGGLDRNPVERLRGQRKAAY